jgi:iron(III) transport system ATP-binding protein
VMIGGAKLRCDNARLPPDGFTSISVRPHDIRISAKPMVEVDNVLTGKVVRQVFLGGHRDFLIRLADGTLVRAMAPADQIILPDAAVWLCVPPERCHVLIG